MNAPKWLMGIVAGLIVVFAGSYIAHIEARFEHQDATSTNLREDVASVKARIPDSDRRLAAIETQLIELNQNVATLTAMAQHEFKRGDR